MAKVERVPLGKVAEIDRQIVDPSEAEVREICLSLEDLDAMSGVVRVPPKRELAKSSKFRFSPAHVLYAKLRPYLGKVVRPETSGICSTDILPILPGSRLDRDFLFHFLRTPTFTAWATQAAVGVNLPRLSPSLLSTFDIPLPTLPSQRRIAEVLDRAEALRAKRRAALALLDSLTQSLFLDLFGDPVANPKAWPNAQLGKLCEKVIDRPHATPVYATSRSEYPCVRSSGIQNGDLTFADTKYVEKSEYEKRIARGKPQVGDVIYCREGARFGNAARIAREMTLCLGQRMMLFRPHPKSAVGEYIWAFLSSPAAYRQATSLVGGSASPHVTIRDIVSFRLPLPPSHCSANSPGE